MDKHTRARLEAAGYRIGDAEDLFELTDEERQIVELRVKMIREIRRLRAAQQLTQQQLAARLKSSQSRVAKIEAGSADVSLDLMFRSFFALGGRLADVVTASRPARTTGQKRRIKKRSPKPAGV